VERIAVAVACFACSRQTLANGRQCGRIIFELFECDSQPVVALDKTRVESNAFLGVLNGLLPVFQPGMTSTAIGKIHVIGSVVLNGLGVVLNRGRELTSGKGLVAESAVICDE
jgi:hypothetical protein